MYAVIATGGKQEKVAAGDRLAVERLGVAVGQPVSFTPLLVVDDGQVVADPVRLASSKVSAKVVGETRGAKIRGFTYKAKSNNRRRWGHRQSYSLIEVTSITPPAG
jgi:large subunit ribosomal protein L21